MKSAEYYDFCEDELNDPPLCFHGLEPVAMEWDEERGNGNVQGASRINRVVGGICPPDFN